VKLFLLLALLSTVQDKPPEKCTLSGTVVSAATGEPLAKVRVLADGLDDPGTPATTTDAKGRFTLVDLNAGEYRLKAQRNGYLDGAYGARRPEGNGTPIEVEPGQTVRDLQIKLTPFGVMAGTIRDADGEPLARMTVTVHRLKYENGTRHLSQAGGAFTDDLGQYRIPDLPPGRYYVFVQGKKAGEFGSMVDMDIETEDHSPKSAAPRTIPVNTMYPGVVDAAAAGTVEVASGARVTGVDIALVRTATVPVKGVVSMPAGLRVGNISLNYAGLDSEELFPSVFTSVDEKGEFEFRQVPPGNYVLMARANLNTRPAGGSFEFFQPELRLRVPVQVGTSPVLGVRVTLESAAEISGRITVDGDDKSSINTGAFEFSGHADHVQVMVATGGTFKALLPAGHYQVLADRLNHGNVVVHSVTAQGRNVMDESFTAEPGKLAMEIVMTHDGGQVEGVALDGEDKPVAGATVVLVPDSKRRSHPDLFQQTESDQRGHFSIDGIPPGDYKVFTWDDVEPGIWWDAEFLKKYESKGEAVTIAVKGKASAKVHLAKE
jgi:hypothetical protein